jgi:uncharacterized OsmC-like protein
MPKWFSVRGSQKSSLLQFICDEIAWFIRHLATFSRNDVLCLERMIVPTNSIKFRARLSWDGESGAEINIKHFKTLKLDMPTRFGGKGRYPCPDELFLSSVAGCLITTFLYFRRKLHIQIRVFDISISTRLTSTPEGYQMLGIDVTMFVEGKESEETKLRRCIKWTKKYCHIKRILEKTVPIRINERLKFVD